MSQPLGETGESKTWALQLETCLECALRQRRCRRGQGVGLAPQGHAATKVYLLGAGGSLFWQFSRRGRYSESAQSFARLPQLNALGRCSVLFWGSEDARCLIHGRASPIPQQLHCDPMWHSKYADEQKCHRKATGDMGKQCECVVLRDVSACGWVFIVLWCYLDCP